YCFIFLNKTTFNYLIFNFYLIYIYIIFIFDFLFNLFIAQYGFLYGIYLLVLNGAHIILIIVKLHCQFQENFRKLVSSLSSLFSNFLFDISKKSEKVKR